MRWQSLESMEMTWHEDEMQHFLPQSSSCFVFVPSFYVQFYSFKQPAEVVDWEECHFCKAQSRSINSIEAKFCLWPKNNEMGFIKRKWGNSESGKALPIALGWESWESWCNNGMEGWVRLQQDGKGFSGPGRPRESEPGWLWGKIKLWKILEV